MEKQTVIYKGKIYGVFTDNGRVVHVRNETNPAKTPYLKHGSPTFLAVAALAKI